MPVYGRQVTIPAQLADRITRLRVTRGTEGFARICTTTRLTRGCVFLAEDTGLEPAGLLHLTRFPGELLSHSVNPPYLIPYLIYHKDKIFARTFIVLYELAWG